MIFKLFDKLEDDIRGWFSHHPILYGFVGGVGAVLFWRGVWHTADWVASILMSIRTGNPSVDMSVFPDGPLSLLFGSVLLLLTGLFVSNFIGNEIIISGLRGEKKVAEKTEKEIKAETMSLTQIQSELEKINERLNGMDLKKETKIPRRLYGARNVR